MRQRRVRGRRRVRARACPTTSFDVVHAHQVLQHVADPVAALREMRRVCQPGGRRRRARQHLPRVHLVSARCPPRPVARPLLRRRRGQRRRAGCGQPAPRLGARRRFRSRHARPASAWCYADDEERAWWGDLWADRITKTALAAPRAGAGPRDSRRPRRARGRLARLGRRAERLVRGAARRDPRDSLTRGGRADAVVVRRSHNCEVDARRRVPKRARWVDGQPCRTVGSHVRDEIRHGAELVRARPGHVSAVDRIGGARAVVRRHRYRQRDVVPGGPSARPRISRISPCSTSPSMRSRRCKRGSPTARIVHFVHHDVLTWEPDRDYDIVHDRAVFHFLTDPGARAHYTTLIAHVVRPVARWSSQRSRATVRRTARDSQSPATRPRSSHARSRTVLTRHARTT